MRTFGRRDLRKWMSRRVQMDCDAMPSKCHTYGRDLESMHNGSIEQQVMPHSCDILYGSMCNSCPSVNKLTRPIQTPHHKGNFKKKLIKNLKNHILLYKIMCFLFFV